MFSASSLLIPFSSIRGIFRLFTSNFVVIKRVHSLLFYFFCVMATLPKGKIIRAQRNCCVIDCPNSESKNPELHFYRFPGRRWEVQRKQMWVEAVDRPAINNETWAPKDHTRICSVHFIGGKKSDNMFDDSYVPSLFPNGRTYKIPYEIEQSIKRSRMMMAGQGFSSQTSSFHDMFEIVNIKCEVPAVETSTIGCQTDPWWDQPTDETNVLFCWNGPTESSTQTEIYVRKPFKPKKIIIQPSNMVDKSSGSDEEMNHSLWRFLQITTDHTMKQLTGIPQEFFLILLSLIMANKGGQPAFFKKLGKEDRLFLFLLKMKLGLPFGALACLFHVHSSTASRVFFQILETLTEKTKHWIFWPTRENVEKNLPSNFSRYPKCRCVFACTEVRTETPPSQEQKIAMYSEQKGACTVKFLLGITPEGYVSKISKGYGGNATNNFITNDSGFLDVLETGDTIMADMSFAQIETDLSKRGVTLVIPQSIDPVNDNPTKKACVRVHVNRTVQKIKLMRILEHFPAELLNHKDAIMHMCCVIANGHAFLNRENLIPQVVSPRYIA